MLIGYVSDERYVALEDVAVEILGDGVSVGTHSRASGAIHADVPPGMYELTFSRAGFWRQAGDSQAADGLPRQFRLLADGLLGYAWPKCRCEPVKV